MSMVVILLFITSAKVLIVEGMKNFRINPQGYSDPQPITHLYAIGTQLKFRNISGRIQAALSIPVQFA